MHMHIYTQTESIANDIMLFRTDILFTETEQWHAQLVSNRSSCMRMIKNVQYDTAVVS
jgi:hypothetical protein